MPYKSIDDAKKAKFPTTIDGGSSYSTVQEVA